MSKYEKYCFCRCPVCGQTKHEWIEFVPNTYMFIADVYCEQCKKLVLMNCIETESNYLW